jgi:CHAT domain-containing protein/tetratricopeptide (TPR) repeat protein
MIRGYMDFKPIKGLQGGGRAACLVFWVATVLMIPVSPTLWAAEENSNDHRSVLYEAGVFHLDAGDNLAAAQWAESLFIQFPTRLEYLEILQTASERLCAPDSILSLIVVREDDSGGASFLAGLKARNRYDFVAAADAFRLSAAQSVARQDTVSAVTGLVNAVDALLQDRNIPGVTKVLEEIDTLVATDSCPPRLVSEVQARGGRLLILAGSNAEAEPIFREILTSAQAHGQRGLIRFALDGLGAVLIQQNRPAEALPFYRESLAEAETLGDVYNQCRMLINLAYHSANRTDNTEPRRLLDEAEARIQACGLAYLLGHVDGTRAVCMEGEVRRPEAIALFQSAARQHEAVGNKGGELGSRQRMAFNLAMQGRFLEARANYETCIVLMEGEESNWIANWVLWGLANVHRNLGDLDTALVYYERALAVSRGLGSLGTVAGVLSEIALVQAQLGRYHQAILLHHEALDIMTELGDTREAARVNARIGDAFYQLGNLNEALDHYQRSYEITRTLDSRLNLSDAVGGLAAIHGRAGDHERAGEGFREALGIARSLDDQEAIIWALMGLAEQQILAGQPAQAREALAEAEQRLAAGGNFHDMARIALLHARIADDSQQARTLATAALEYAQEGGLPADEWECWSDLGQYQAALGDTAAAMASQLAAMEVVESLWLKVGAEELRRHLLEWAGLPYERMVNLLGSSGTGGDSALEALEYAERSRARLLSHRLAMAGSTTPAWFGGGLSEEAREVAAAIAMRQSRLQEPGLEIGTRNILKEEIGELEKDFKLLRLNNLKSSEGGFGLADKAVPGLLDGLAPDETALYFFLGDDRSYLFTARGGRVQSWPLAPREMIEDRLRLYLGLWTQMNNGNSGQGDSGGLSLGDFDAASASLFRFLIGPAAGELAGLEKIVIIPDGLLHRLPFAALLDGEGRPLGQREISLAPSLEVLARLRAGKEHGSDSADQEKMDVIAVGCGLIGEGGEGMEQRVNPFTGEPLLRLPQAEAEARQVASLFNRSLLMIGDRATEAEFRNLDGLQTDILHIAAHGVADEKEVRRSFVVLNPPVTREGADALDDGILQWYEVADLSLDAQLVTLSSCRSAAGVLAKGEGMTGLTQAFLFAGSRCVLATLTDVPDSYAAAFMGDFYRSFKDGQTAAEALSAAVELARNEPGDTPGRPLWAAFTLVGDGSVRVSNPGGGRIWPFVRNSLIGLVLVAGLVMIIRWRKP